MRLILNRGSVQRLVSPCAVGLSVRNYSEIYWVQMDIYQLTKWSLPIKYLGITLRSVL
jgi:hypothetical protein